ncbi:urea ABC transporter ATP-binding subunit UrtE [Pontibaca salina]|uniref:Urea ABC transporter ATP-binding subunit UrtE n=1 Tax=Pontibaca salina TaxID=2795731 RepID=A0A934M0F2_9RHOB|nr:urea ABC transporter ATP-binding subunit UrtE [Pontibaca salina]MBI6629950.1 urea ABC transporter ATP-binding subunit UrtE [Pontibaca salina]
MLDLSNVNTFYGKSHILHNFELSIEPGTIHAILGRNGVGKTTLLSCILGLTDRSDGTMSFNGRDIISTATHERARAGISIVPQGRQIFPDFSIKENILMGGFAHPDGKRQVPDIVSELFPYLIDNMSRPGGLLSGGQQQQLAIARALAAAPKVLLMDEPTEGIQPNIVEQIENTIIRLNSEFGLTILLVEQNIKFARRAAKNYTIIEKGCPVDGGLCRDLTDNTIHKYLSV